MKSSYEVSINGIKLKGNNADASINGLSIPFTFNHQKISITIRQK
jgi:hypothetical protein